MKTIRAIALILILWGIIGGWSILGQWQPHLNQLTKDQATVAFGLILLTIRNNKNTT